MAQPTESSSAPRFSILRRQRGLRWTTVVAVTLAVTLIAAYAFTPSLHGPKVAGAQPLVGAQTMASHTLSVAPAGRGVPAHWSSTLARRSASEGSTEQAGLARMQNLQAPRLSMSSAKATSPANLSQPLVVPTQASQKFGVTHPAGTSPLADTSFDVEQTNNSSASGGPAAPCTGGFCATVAEPSVADNGGTMMESYNWFDTFSKNGGSSFSYLDPFSEFSSFTPSAPFCCDQQVIYEPSRNIMWWEQLYLNGASPTANPGGLGIATSSGTDLTSWCFYYFTGATFGGSNGDVLDFPDMEFTNDNMFLSFNRYNAGGSFITSDIVRLALTPMSSCGTATGSFSSDGTVFNHALTQGAQGTMYYSSNAFISGGTTGSQVQLCKWPDPAGGPTCVVRSINPFNYTSSPNCGSQDAVVTNWCTRLDSRVRSMFMTKADFRGFGPLTLGIAMTVGPAGSDPFPWVAIYYFQVTGFTYVTEDALFNNTLAFAYPSFAANFRGFIGAELSFGGGTGSSHTFPSAMILIYDPTNPTPPFANLINVGSGNATEWGDYTTVRPMYPSAFAWIGGFWLLDGSGNILPGEVIWDRGRDHNAYLRWFLS